MDQRDSHCPYLLSSETTAKGTGLEKSAGKEDPVELDSSLTLSTDSKGVVVGGRGPTTFSYGKAGLFNNEIPPPLMSVNLLL